MILYLLHKPIAIPLCHACVYTQEIILFDLESQIPWNDMQLLVDN